MAHPHKGDAAKHHAAKIHRMLGGHVDAADKKADEAMIRSAIRQHETQEHGGKHSDIKFRAHGGAVDHEHEKPKERRDRRARGGKTEGKHAKGAHVNVIVAPQMHPGMAPGAGALPAPATAAPMPPPRPPMMPPAGGMPGAPGGIAGAPPIAAMAPRVPPMAPGMPPRKRGGKVYPIDDGAGSGEGRLEKARAYGSNSNKGEGRKRGGKVEDCE